MRYRSWLGTSSVLAIMAFGATASAQYGGYPPVPQQPGYYPPQQPYYQQPTPTPPSKARSSPLEVGYLYITAAAWGVGTGIWIDAEAGVEDPGLRFIAPLILGVAAPMGVFFADRPPMPRGLPSAIATGMIIGAGEGLGVASLQHVTADAEHEWSFRGLARAEIIGSTLGGLAGGLSYYFIRQSPKTNMFVASAAVWGTAIGNEFGGGASNGDWSQTNDSVGLGGLVGFNVALAGSVAFSTFWTPSWNQIGWMWLGLGIGTAASLPVYIFYAGSDSDPRRGLIFQGVAGTLGLVGGALIGTPDSSATRGEGEQRPAFARVLGGSLIPVDHGMGAQIFGELW